MTILQNVMIGDNLNIKANLFDCFLHTPKFRKEEKKSKEKAMDLLKLLGMEDRANDYVGGVPYGLQKRVEVARAIITEPKLLLLDEPMAGLNTMEAEDLMGLIMEVKKVKKLTVIMIEHNMKVMMSSAERIIAMDAGKEISMGSPEKVQNDPVVIRAYLGEGA